MRVLVGCEFSGIVRESFRKAGHDAYSCDLLPAEDESPYHYQCDLLSPEVWFSKWDLGILFPPCTHLAVSGARWFSNKKKEQESAIKFVRILMHLPIVRLAIENPIGIISTRIRKPDQIIQPWMFGHGFVKATCLWLKNLPILQETFIHPSRYPLCHYSSPSPDRWKDRSRTFQGIADAMAEQWGNL